jgi:hypothetical protein
MRDDSIVIGLLAALTTVLLLPVLAWVALATLALVDGGDGCAWILGVGGCIGTPTHP